ncbi:MAG: RNA-binding protein [Planctomycetaceae bacterium]|jgi:RNA recognition motif-containing protein|nr:RNA-binding protein [Planctomycetaceae bacterium]
MMRIYVGNLAYRTTKEDLREAFEQFGTVNSTDVITDRETGRSKGFGFVEMLDAQEAENAINGMDGKDLDSRTLKVNEARQMTPRQGGGGGGGNFRPRSGGGNRETGRRYSR